jgi:hypothetical protein
LTSEIYGKLVGPSFKLKVADIRKLTLRQIQGLYVDGQQDRRPDVKEPETEAEVWDRMFVFGKTLGLSEPNAAINANKAVEDWKRSHRGESANEREPTHQPPGA